MTTRHTRLSLLGTALLSGLAFTFTVNAATMVSTGGYNTQLQKMGMMKMLDDNADHMVTAQEFNGYYGHVFDELDLNRNGTLDSKEWLGTKGEEEISLATGGYSRELRKMSMMKTIDTNGDQKVSRDEFIKFHQSLFMTMDKNNDSQLDPQEWLARQVGS